MNSGSCLVSKLRLPSLCQHHHSRGRCAANIWTVSGRMRGCQRVVWQLEAGVCVLFNPWSRIASRSAGNAWIQPILMIVRRLRCAHWPRWPLLRHCGATANLSGHREDIIKFERIQDALKPCMHASQGNLASKAGLFMFIHTRAPSTFDFTN